MKAHCADAYVRQQAPMGQNGIIANEHYHGFIHLA